MSTNVSPSYSPEIDLALQVIADSDMDFPGTSWRFLVRDMCARGLLTSDAEGGWMFTAWGKAELRRRGWRAPWWTWTGLRKRVRRWREALEE